MSSAAEGMLPGGALALALALALAEPSLAEDLPPETCAAGRAGGLICNSGRVAGRNNTRLPSATGLLGACPSTDEAREAPLDM